MKPRRLKFDTTVVICIRDMGRVLNLRLPGGPTSISIVEQPNELKNLPGRLTCDNVVNRTNLNPEEA